MATKNNNSDTEKQKTLKQIIWFTILNCLAFLVQLLIVNIGPLCLSKWSNTSIFVWPFGNLTLSYFISFLLANIAAKVIAYILNRKKTFNATKNLAFSITTYIIMCVTLIIVETVIAEPLANVYDNIFHNMSLSTNASMITYCLADFILVFILEKFVIMNDKLFNKKSKNEIEETTIE